MEDCLLHEAEGAQAQTVRYAQDPSGSGVASDQGIRLCSIRLRPSWRRSAITPANRCAAKIATIADDDCGHIEEAQSFPAVIGDQGEHQRERHDHEAVHAHPKPEDRSVTGGGHSRSRWLRSSRNRAPAGGGLELSIAGRNDAGLGRARNCRCPASRLPADAGTTVRFANHLASLWLVEVIPVETRTASRAAPELMPHDSAA